VRFLKKATERAKKVGGIKDLIQREVGGFEKARSGKKIHASELTNDVEYCPRQIRLMELLEKKPRDKWIPGILRMTFDDGNAKQWQISNIYLREYMVGHWDTPDKSFLGPWSVGPPDNEQNWSYVEPFFIDPISEAQGAVDGLVKFTGAEKLRMVEMKIMATSMFRDLKAPLAEHKLRTLLYLALIARSDHPHKNEIDTSKASVLYCLRGHGVKDETGEISPFKEFVVKRNDDAVEYLFDKAKELTLARGGGPLPKQICPHQMCPRAEKCPVSKECFSVSISPDPN